MLSWAAAAVAALCGALAWRFRRRAATLEARLLKASHELEGLQHAFQRFAPAEVVEQMIARDGLVAPETKDVTILFADLKSFTALAERLEPAVLVGVLNGYFDAMGRTIASHRGHLAKFIGDGLLAFFGGLEPNPWQTNDALHTALAMRAALDRYNASLAQQGLPALAMGVGIHRGPVVAGVLGTAALLEYGVIGRNVNLAARIEELTRTHGVDILVSEAAARRCDPRFQLRALPAVHAKGIPEPVVTYALDGVAEPR